MTKILLIIILLFAAAAGVFFFLWRLTQAEHKRTKDQLELAKKQLKAATEEIQKIEQTLEIINHNRKETDEKINALNNGDVLDNALNELSKH